MPDTSDNMSSKWTGGNVAVLVDVGSTCWQRPDYGNIAGRRGFDVYLVPEPGTALLVRLAFALLPRAGGVDATRVEERSAAVITPRS